MNESDRHERVRLAFHRIMSARETEREAILLDVVSTEPDLREDIESLLTHAPEGESLEAAAASWRQTAPFLFDASAPPTRLGRYRLVRHLGSGSMGAVFLAERDHPRRTVAVKVLHRAFASSRHRRRFEMESEILGRLDHPGIAGVLDAGCESDHPFFVMEYVDGVPL
ncbi:MAG: protein kinase, partial [Phycisphaerales bacterium]|nr:protein kinase [Phycisphaerales bacterium]